MTELLTFNDMNHRWNLARCCMVSGLCVCVCVCCVHLLRCDKFWSLCVCSGLAVQWKDGNEVPIGSMVLYVITSTYSRLLPIFLVFSFSWSVSLSLFRDFRICRLVWLINWMKIGWFPKLNIGSILFLQHNNRMEC
jgi:hypothetical protein